MMPLKNADPAFEQRYACHLKHLKLQGLQAKTVDAYANPPSLPCRRVRRTLGSQSLVAPLRTSHPSGSRKLGSQESPGSGLEFILFQ